MLPPLEGDGWRKEPRRLFERVLPRGARAVSPSQVVAVDVAGENACKVRGAVPGVL